MTDLVEYKQQYMENFAAQIADYLNAANQCPVGNGNATRAPARSMTGAILGYVARLDIGWVLPVGAGDVGTSLIVHGYASVDPQVAGENVQIEFVSMWRR